MSTFKVVADIQTADMLKLPVPKANFYTEVIQPSEGQQDMVAQLADRAEDIRAGNVDPSVDNMLMMNQLYGIGRNLNQIAIKAHTLNVIDVQRYDQAYAEFEKAVKEITEAVLLPRVIK